MAKSICKKCKRLYPYAVASCYCGSYSMSIDFTNGKDVKVKRPKQLVIDDLINDVIECRGSLFDKKM